MKEYKLFRNIRYETILKYETIIKIFAGPMGIVPKVRNTIRTKMYESVTLTVQCK